MPLPLLAPILYGLATVGVEESIRHALGGTIPSNTDLAEQSLRIDERAKMLDLLGQEEYKAKQIPALSSISSMLDRLESRGNAYTASTVRMLLDQHQEDLATIAQRTPPSPVEVLAHIRALSGIR